MRLTQSGSGFTRRLWSAVANGIAHFTKTLRGGEPMMASMFSSGGAYSALGTWTQDKLEQVRRFRGWQYIGIRVVAEEDAMMAPQIGRRRAPEQVTKSLRRSGRLLRRSERVGLLCKSIQPHEEIELADSADPLRRLLDNPNGPDTSYTFRYRTRVFLELTGEAYWLKVRNAFGAVIELWPLFPHWVTPRTSAEKLIDHYEVRPYGYGAVGIGMQEVAPEDVVAFRYPSPFTLINGHAPVGACAEWVDVDEAIEASQWYAFENGNHPGVIFELDDKVFGAGRQFDEAMIDRFYARYDARHGGRERHRRPLVVNPGMTAKPWTNTPAEMDYSHSAEVSRDRILAIMRVSKTLAGLTDDVKYDNLAGATANFLERTMGPKRAFDAEVMTEQLARPDFGEDIIIFWRSSARPDPKQLNEDIELDARLGAITPNEIRQLRGREPYEHGGDNPIIGGVEMPWVEELESVPTGDVAGVDDSIWYATDNEDIVSDARMNGVSKSWRPTQRRGQPGNRGQFASDRSSVTPPSLPFRPPPKPEGISGRRAGGWSAIRGMTNTSLGDLAEAAVRQLGLRSLLPPGKRQNPLDAEYDHSGIAFEIKACSTSAQEYKAKPKAAEVASKIAYARRHGLKPATMIVVLDMKRGEAHAYWRPGIGAYALTEANASQWNYMGTVSVESASRN